MELPLIVLIFLTQLVNTGIGEHKAFNVDLVGLAEVDDLTQEHVSGAVALQKLAEYAEFVSLLLLLLHSAFGLSNGGFIVIAFGQFPFVNDSMTPSKGDSGFNLKLYIPNDSVRVG